MQLPKAKWDLSTSGDILYLFIYFNLVLLTNLELNLVYKKTVYMRVYTSRWDSDSFPNMGLPFLHSPTSSPYNTKLFSYKFFQYMNFINWKWKLGLKKIEKLDIVIIF